MGADESAGGGTLTVGPTTGGTVRILVEDRGARSPMDFEPNQAEKIADELRAAERARAADRQGARSPAANARPDGPPRR